LRILRLVLFLLIFTAVYMGINYLALSRLYVWYGLAREGIFYECVLFLGLFFPAAAVLERTLHSGSTRIFYICASILMGMVTVFIGLTGIYEIFRAILPSRFIPEPYYLMVLLLVLSVYGIVNARGFVVKEIPLQLAHLKKPIDIVQLSDLHVGVINRAAYLKTLAQRINRLKPAMVLITGDLFDGSTPVDVNTIQPLADLNMPVFLSAGNHELYEGLHQVEKIISTTNIRLLRNEMTMLGGIQIIGIDNPVRESRRDLPALREISFDPSLPTILLYHPPTGMEDAEKAGIDLQLSGHTHYGQIWPFSWLVRLFYRYGFGLHHFRDMTLYTSPGTGTWGPPMRIGSKNEVTLFHLKPKENSRK